MYLSILQIVLFSILLLCNGACTALYLQEYKDIKLVFKFLIAFLGSYIAFPVFLLIVLYVYIKEFLTNYIWVEIRFLWNFYLVKDNWIEKAVLKDVNCLYSWNIYAERRNNQTYFDRRWTRHINMINKRYNYDFKADKEKRSKSENEDERFTESR